MVLRFGKYVPGEVPPGLNYHLPYPIETALTPPALRVNKTDVGMRAVEDIRRGPSVRELPEESLMLTGDENIVDVEFSVLWRVKPNSVAEYLFNIQNPEGTVKAVAESAMREVIGRSNVQPLLTGAAAKRRDGGAGADAEDARFVWRRHSDTECPAAESRSAVGGHRFVPRRAGGALRSRARPERSADLCQPRRPRSARPRRQDHPGRRSLSRADGRRSQGRNLPLPANLRAIQKSARSDPQANVSGNHGTRSRREQQDDHRHRAAVRAGCHTLSSAHRAAGAAPAAARRRTSTGGTQ